jgi:hypothetical protein
MDCTEPLHRNATGSSFNELSNRETVCSASSHRSEVFSGRIAARSGKSSSVLQRKRGETYRCQLDCTQNSKVDQDVPPMSKHQSFVIDLYVVVSKKSPYSGLLPAQSIENCTGLCMKFYSADTSSHEHYVGPKRSRQQRVRHHHHYSTFQKL